MSRSIFNDIILKWHYIFFCFINFFFTLPFPSTRVTEELKRHKNGAERHGVYNK